jgi:hypothetical protein
MTIPALLMIIALPKLVATMYLNHLAMTTTHVLKITVMYPLANVSLNQFPAMITMHVPTTNAYLNMVAVTAMFIVTITMNVLRIHVILELAVNMKIFLMNVKLITNVTKTIVILKLDVLMIWLYVMTIANVLMTLVIHLSDVKPPISATLVMIMMHVQLIIAIVILDADIQN